MAPAAAVAILAASLASAACDQPMSRTQSGGGYVKPPAHAQDVLVYVHGLWSDSKSAWESSTNTYWPRLVADDPDFAGLDVYVAEYDSRPTGRLDLDELSNNLFQRLRNDRVFEQHKRVILLTHSLGGLVASRLLLLHRDLAPKVPLMFLYGTPQTGSQFANVGMFFSDDPVLKEIAVWDSVIKTIENDWRSAHLDIRRECAVEKLPTNGIVIVPQLSATRLCDGVPTAMNKNHLDLVKPLSRRDDPYILASNVLHDLLKASNVDTTPRATARGPAKTQSGPPAPVRNPPSADDSRASIAPQQAPPPGPESGSKTTAADSRSEHREETTPDGPDVARDAEFDDVSFRLTSAVATGGTLNVSIRATNRGADRLLIVTYNKLGSRPCREDGRVTDADGNTFFPSSVAVGNQPRQGDLINGVPTIVHLTFQRLPTIRGVLQTPVISRLALYPKVGDACGHLEFRNVRIDTR